MMLPLSLQNVERDLALQKLFITYANRSGSCTNHEICFEEKQSELHLNLRNKTKNCTRMKYVKSHVFE
jgi:hypothetical protein